MPTGGKWTPLKNEATRFRSGPAATRYTRDLLSDFIRAIGD